MERSGRFRALSLDLWFTTLYYTRAQDERWREERARLLTEARRTGPGEGDRPSSHEVHAAMEAVHAGLGVNRYPTTVDPAELISAYADQLHARPSVPLAELARAYSAAGLAEHPPQVNPEAVSLVRALVERGIPVVAVTNTGRREASWQAFLQAHTDLRFRHVITSCELGRAKPDAEIYWEAARRLGLAPSEILHVGDRWELDAEGALRAGLGTALYRGLWRFYPEGEYPETNPRVAEAAGVATIDRLDEVLEDGLLI